MTTTATNPARSMPEKALAVVGIANAALTKAAAELAKHEAIEAKLAALRPQAVEACVAGERIEDNQAQRQKLAEMLKDPVKTMELLVKIATHRNTAEQSLGQPVDAGQTKTSAAGNGRQFDSLSDCRPGMRTTMTKQSDINLFRRLGLSPPTE